MEIDKLYENENNFIRAEKAILTFSESLKKEGKERMSLGGKGYKFDDKFNQEKIMADSVQLSHDTIHRVKYILDSKNEDIILKARQGLISVSGSYNDLRHNFNSLPRLGTRVRICSNWNIIFVQQEGGGPIYIGKVKSVESKLKKLQIYNPIHLNIIKVLYDVPSSKKVEIQKQFEKYKVKDNWYSDEIYHLIKEIK